MTRFISTGTLGYGLTREGQPKMNLTIDPEIARYYRWFVPKAAGVHGTRYAPHISVVRHEAEAVRSPAWGTHEGELVEFEYSSWIYSDETYFWLRAFSPRLEELRLELGLTAHRLKVTCPPDGVRCFHVTIGNRK